MRNALMTVALILLLPRLSPSSDAVVPGAKDLFYDSLQGQSLSVRVEVRNSTRQDVRNDASGDSSREKQKTVKKRLPEDERRGRSTAARKPPLVTPRAEQPPGLVVSGGNRGLHYWIEVETPDGEGRYVSAQEVFHSGQRIRLHFVSNADGRIHLLQIGSSGNSMLLFPDPEEGLVDDHMKAGQNRILPSESHWFRFDDQPGTERLLVMFARDVAELGQIPLKPRMGSDETRALMQTVSHVQGSKDLFVETEARSGAEVGTYGVNVTGGPVIMEILLQHGGLSGASVSSTGIPTRQ